MSSPAKGFTLVEMTVVILVLLTLVGVGLGVSGQYGKWQLGRAAAEDLRFVYSAQRMFLSDNPTVLVEDITAADVIPYLANRATELPTVKSLDGAIFTIDPSVSPPTVVDGSGGVYDPSGSSTDLLWDVGE